MLACIGMERRWQPYALGLAAFFLLFEAAVWGSGSTGFFTSLLSGISASLFAALVTLLFVFIKPTE